MNEVKPKLYESIRSDSHYRVLQLNDLTPYLFVIK